MRKKQTLNIALLIFAILAIIIIYNIFNPDTVVAPEASSDFQKAQALTTEVQSEDYQEVDKVVKAAVLMYHHVGSLPEKADDIRKGLTVSSEEFESQVKYLSEQKYEFMTLAELKKVIDGKKVPKKIAILTFDDGYDDNYNHAWPIMKKYKAKGTFFLIVDKLGKPEYMSRDNAVELYKSDNEIGSHSMTHPSLEKLKGNSLEKEIKSSKEELEKLTSSKVVSFCYPAGKYNDETTKALSDAGYQMAVTTQSSTGELNIDNMLEIPRYRISSSMSFESRFR